MSRKGPTRFPECSRKSCSETSRRVADAGMNDPQQSCDEFFLKRNEKLRSIISVLLNEPSTPGATKARHSETEVARSILCVDGDQATRQIYSEVLRTSGYRVDLAEDG